MNKRYQETRSDRRQSMSNNNATAVIVRVMNAIDRCLLVLAQIVLASLMTMTFVNVLGRSLFHVSVPDSLIISEMMMVAIVFLPLGYVQSVGSHIEVTVLTDLMSKRIQDALFAVGLALGVLVFGLMTWLGWLSAHEAFLSGSYGFNGVLYLPEWPVKMLIPLGLGWWCLRMLLQLLLPSTRPVEQETELEQALRDTKSHDIDHMKESR